MWNLFKNLLFLILTIFYKQITVHCLVKIWKPNTNIENRDNWIGGTYSKNCHGLIFPEYLGESCVMSVNEIITQEIILPMEGDILINEGGSITFSTNNDNCIRLKYTDVKYWNDPENWSFEGKNRAVPDVEKLPCEYDDVVFPENSTFNVHLTNVASYVNSIHLNGKFISDGEWSVLLSQFSDCQQFVQDIYFGFDVENRIKIRPKTCAQKSGCTCHTNKNIIDDFCLKHLRFEHAPCFKPIGAVGHCRPLCGGVLRVTPNEEFVLDEFRKKLPLYDNVDTYASKVFVDKEIGEAIQVVIVEKIGFNGDSIIISETLYSQLKKNLQEWKIKNVTMFVSGHPHNGKEVIRNTILIVFGTLLLVAVVFGLIFFAFSGSHSCLLATRLPFSNRLSQTVAGRFAFARFDNKGEGELSLAGSVLSLEKEFDNPLYQRSGPSGSSSTIEEVLPTSKEDERKVNETTFENLAYFGDKEEKD